MTDPYGLTRSLDAIMGAMSPDATPDTDYAAEAREALRIASGVDGGAAQDALVAAIVAFEAPDIARDYPAARRAEVAATLRAIRAGLEGTKG